MNDETNDNELCPDPHILPWQKSTSWKPRKHRWVISWTGKTKQCPQCEKLIRLEDVKP